MPSPLDGIRVVDLISEIGISASEIDDLRAKRILG
jgi:hypothetical protein